MKVNCFDAKEGYSRYLNSLAVASLTLGSGQLVGLNSAGIGISAVRGERLFRSWNKSFKFQIVPICRLPKTPNFYHRSR